MNIKEFEAGEFDMVIYDTQKNTCEIYETKHSSESDVLYKNVEEYLNELMR